MGKQGPGDDDGRTARRLPVQPPKPGKAMSIVVLLFGLAIVGGGAYSYVTDSTTLSSTVEVTAEVTDISAKQVEASRGRDAYVPTVTFRYQFEGTTYTSDKLYPGVSQPRYEDSAAALDRLSGYTVGESVTAYVDPDTPGEAFLEDSRSGQSSGAVFVGVLVSILGGIGLYQARQQSRRRARRSRGGPPS